MPKINPARQVVHEKLAARRIRDERVANGWTLDDVARKVTESGCPLDRAAVHKVESGARRISVDELVAFGNVFGRSIAALVVPADSEVQKLLREHQTLEEKVREGHRKLREIERRIVNVAEDDNRQLVVDWLEQKLPLHPGNVQLEIWRRAHGHEPDPSNYYAEPPPPAGWTGEENNDG